MIEGSYVESRLAVDDFLVLSGTDMTTRVPCKVKVRRN